MNIGNIRKGHSGYVKGFSVVTPDNLITGKNKVDNSL